MTSFFIYSLIIFHFIHIFECNNDCSKTICNPRAGDLLIGRESFLIASSTCGLTEMEKYCVVTTSDSGRKSKCDICYSKDSYQQFSSIMSHRIENIVSRLPRNPGRWWQSKNGVHNVSIEISFESEFQFTFTHFRFKTYRPAAMYIERSKDYGISWEKYAYFSDNCKLDFPTIPERKRSHIGDITCTSEFSSIMPSEGGTVLFSADTSDWNTEDQFWNKKRNDITAITNLRVRFLRLHTFGDGKVDDNPNLRNKYYYAISEWIIRGRCSCYGHASRCKPKEGQMQIKEMVYGVCECQHNTKGQHCEKCTDFFNDSPWLPADKNSTNACKKCNCNNHASSCHFNPVVYLQSDKKSGGVCDNCEHNTESKNCERCKSGYYRNSLVSIVSPETCLKCQCVSQGTRFPQLCIQETELERNLMAGSCICKENVEGRYCDKCKIGYWNFNGENESGCIKCKCMMMGTIDNQGCDAQNGNCYCKNNVMGKDCSTCKGGFYNLSSSNPDGCLSCNCNKHGSVNYQSCNTFNGQCNCKDGFTGKTCSLIKSGWYIEQPQIPLTYPEEIKIDLPPVSKTGHYNFIITMDTQQMLILDTYVILLRINQEKKSSCLDYQDAMQLLKETKHIVIPNKCLEKDLTITVTVSIIEQPSDKFLPPSIIDIVIIPILDSNSTKTRNIIADCLKFKQSMFPKHCEFLLTETSSKIVSRNDPKKCNCNVTGSIDNACNKLGGQCSCLHNVGGIKCNKCTRNSYGFDARGCKKCNCDPNGSLNLQCSFDTGKCFCRNGVDGQQCDSCKSGNWNFPFCESCKCNNMADKCDQKTGKCINCRGNSFGFNCQQCNNGYYGDTSRGIPCKKCSCPGSLTDRNNSIGCSLIFNTTTYFCICKPGYRERFCDTCEINYFGNPLNNDGSCNPCKCSGNINMNVSNSCNSRTGECTKCLYNTAGFNCEKCAPGYFGDGAKRTCRKCVCNKLGTDFKSNIICNHETGKCPCLPNVIGHECDQCQDRFYNMSSANGCSPCNCDFPIGSVNQICNKLTGQCNCFKTRSGLKCDNCQDGYWGDPKRPRGCKVCSCKTEAGSLFKQCDRNTGACRCRPGITGRYCDTCMKGTDGKMPKCDSCGACWLQWDSIIEKFIGSQGNLTNEALSMTTKPQYPKEISVLFSQIENNIRLSKSLLKFFPVGFDTTVNKIEMKLLDLQNIFKNINPTDFNGSVYSLNGIRNRINLAKESVSKDKIKDIQGANNEIQKSLKLVSDAILKSNKLLDKVKLMRNDVSYQKEELRQIDIYYLERKNQELDNLLAIMLKNLVAFNGLICYHKTNNNPLKCSEFCGGVGCKPDMCHRNSSINSHCMASPQSSSFFNAIAWSIESRKDLESKLKQMNDLVIEFNLKNISGAHAKTDNEYKSTAKLVGFTNYTIQTKYDNVKQLFKKLELYLNRSANEKDFQFLVEKISKFDLSFDRNEIKNLEEEITKRKNKLTNVISILEKSKDNRNSCEILKKAAIQARKDATDLFSAINNVNGNYEAAKKYKTLINILMANFTKHFMDLQNKFEMIGKNQKTTSTKQDLVDETINKMKMKQLILNQLLSNFTITLDQLKEKQKQQFKILNTVKNKMLEAGEKKNKIISDNGVTDTKISQEFQKLVNNINKLSEKIKISREKLESEKRRLQDWEKQLEFTNKEIDMKLMNIASLQESIYSKSEFHAKCLP